MKNLRIVIWTVTALLIASTAALGGVTEVDIFTYSWVQISLQSPGGGIEVIDLYGPSRINVFFEGPTEGDANDGNGNGLDEVVAEIVDMNLTGTSSYGPVSLRLNLGVQSLGEIEETVNNTAGMLDVRPLLLLLAPPIASLTYSTSSISRA